MIISESIKQVAESPDRAIERIGAKVGYSKNQSDQCRNFVLYLFNNTAIVVDLSTSEAAINLLIQIWWTP